MKPSIILSLALLQPIADVESAQIGAINPNVTQKNIMQTVCVPGWTKTVRPPTSFTNALKAGQLPVGADPKDYEEDHVIPIALGGDPVDPKKLKPKEVPDNLRPQPWKGPCNARIKDVDETRTHRELCKGAITLAEAQARFRPWVCKNP